MKQLRIGDIDLQGVKAVVFDLDGTLYDNRLLIARLALADPRHALWMLADRQTRKKLKGVDFGNAKSFYQGFIDEISKKTGISFEHIKDWYINIYTSHILKVLRKHYKVADYVEPLLKALRDRGITIVIFSDYGCVDDKLRAIGLLPELIDHREVTADFGGLKPCKGAFERLLLKLGLSAQEVLMIGDRDESDGEGARSIGMRFIKV